MNDGYASFVLDGTLHQTINSHNHRKWDFSSMPLNVPNSGAVQMIVSEYTLNRMLEVAVEMSMVQYMTDQTSGNIDAIISEFESAFGIHEKVPISVEGY